jgi:hypothetical protein
LIVVILKLKFDDFILGILVFFFLSSFIILFTFLISLSIKGVVALLSVCRQCVSRGALFTSLALLVEIRAELS